MSQPPALTAELYFSITLILVVPIVAVKGTVTEIVLVPLTLEFAEGNTISPVSKKSPSLFQSIQA